MVQPISGDIGGGVTASIRVPQGGDPFDVPGDTAVMAADILAAIKAKPVPTSAGGGRNYYSGNEASARVELGPTGYQNLGLAACATPTSYDWIGVAKVYCNFDVSGTEADSKIRVRFSRTVSGQDNFTGYQDFIVPAPYKGSFLVSHIWFFTGDKGGVVKVAFDRSSGWTVHATTRHVYAFYLERKNARLLAADGSDLFSLPGDVDFLDDLPVVVPEDLKLWTPSTYYERNASGLRTIHETDLAWMNAHAAAVGQWSGGRTVAEEYGPAWAAGEKTRLGDGSFAAWDGAAWVAA